MKAYDDHILGHIYWMHCQIPILFENNEIRIIGTFNDGSKVLQIMIWIFGVVLLLIYISLFYFSSSTHEGSWQRATLH